MAMTIVVAAYCRARSWRTTVFASQIAGEGERHLAQAGIFGLIVISDLDTVVGVDARASRHAQRICAHAVIIEHHGDPRLRAPQNLSSQTWVTVVFGVRLPSVDDPRLNLQLVGGEPLNPNAVEEPWRVRGNKGRLVRPIVEVVVAKQTDVRHENSCVDVEPMVHIEVIPAPGFREVPVSVVEVPLANACAGVIA